MVVIIGKAEEFEQVEGQAEGQDRAGVALARRAGVLRQPDASLGGKGADRSDQAADGSVAPRPLRRPGRARGPGATTADFRKQRMAF